MAHSISKVKAGSDKLIYIKSLKDKRKIIKIISKSISFTNYDSQFLMG